MVDTLQNKIIVKPDKEYASCIKFFLKIIPPVVIVFIVLNLYEGFVDYRWGAPVALCLGYLILLRQWRLTGQSYIFDSKGVVVMFGKKEWRYTWDELKHKQIVYKVQENGRFANANKCLVLSSEAVKDSLRSTPFEAGNKSEKLRVISGFKGGSAALGVIQLFQSSSIIKVYFDSKQKICDSEGLYYGTVDYISFMAKLSEWGIQIEDEV